MRDWVQAEIRALNRPTASCMPCESVFVADPEGAHPGVLPEVARLAGRGCHRVGDPICDDLARIWLRIEAAKFTTHKKHELVQRLVVVIKQRQVSWPREWGVLTDELKRYEYAIGSSGAITYSAPSGFHDDAVIALALGASARYIEMHAGVMTTFTTPRRVAAHEPRGLPRC
jgi:hypothetical protein